MGYYTYNKYPMDKSYIYIIGSDNPPYKVGISKDPNRRLRNLQTGHPYPLKIHLLKETDVSRTKLLETVIHRHLKFYKTSGEWFDVNLENLKLDVEYALMRYEDDPSLEFRLNEKLIY